MMFMEKTGTLIFSAPVLVVSQGIGWVSRLSA